LNFQGVYHRYNAQINDDFLPVQFSFQFHVEVKGMGRVQGARKNMLLGMFTAVLEFTPNGVVKSNRTKNFVDTLIEKAVKDAMATIQ
jgi:hypothetical protein